MVKASREAGSFLGGGLGGFLSSPFGLGSLGVVALGVTLFIFRKQISEFFQKGFESIGGLGNINLNLPSLPDITLPSLPELPQGFELPKFEIPTFNLDFLFPKAPLTEAEQFDFSGLEGGVSPEPTGVTPDPFRDAAIFAKDFPETFVPIAPTPEPVTVAPSLLDQIIAPFSGGGVSFEGGTIFETPIENLSLSQIIDKFMVTASQAADIRAQAIGFTPEEQAFLSQGQEISPLGDVSSMPAVTEGFEGLTPEQIFAQLVGGNISNF